MLALGTYTRRRRTIEVDGVAGLCLLREESGGLGGLLEGGEFIYPVGFQREKRWECVCLSMTELMPAVVVVVLLLFCRGSGLGLEFIVCLAGTDLRLRILIQDVQSCLPRLSVCANPVQGTTGKSVKRTS